MRTLALDIGRKKTGVAYLDDATGIALPLDTLHHASSEEMLGGVRTLMQDRRIDVLVVGLPKLPSGDEGEQAAFVRSLLPSLGAFGARVELRDERYTTPKRSGHKHTIAPSEYDGDAAAACALLSQKEMC